MLVKAAREEKYSEFELNFDPLGRVDTIFGVQTDRENDFLVIVAADKDKNKFIIMVTIDLNDNSNQNIFYADLILDFEIKQILEINSRKNPLVILFQLESNATIKPPSLILMVRIDYPLSIDLAPSSSKPVTQVNFRIAQDSKTELEGSSVAHIRLEKQDLTLESKKLPDHEQKTHLDRKFSAKKKKDQSFSFNLLKNTEFSQITTGIEFDTKYDTVDLKISSLLYGSPKINYFEDKFRPPVELENLKDKLSFCSSAMEIFESPFLNTKSVKILNFGSKHQFSYIFLTFTETKQILLTNGTTEEKTSRSFVIILMGERFGIKDSSMNANKCYSKKFKLVLDTDDNWELSHDFMHVSSLLDDKEVLSERKPFLLFFYRTVNRKIHSHLMYFDENNILVVKEPTLKDT